LPRRANHWHIAIVARISKVRAGKSAAGFLLSGTREHARTIDSPCTKNPEIIGDR
jgi:hypothetical protein